MPLMRHVSMVLGNYGLGSILRFIIIMRFLLLIILSLRNVFVLVHTRASRIKSLRWHLLLGR